MQRNAGGGRSLCDGTDNLRNAWSVPEVLLFGKNDSNAGKPDPQLLPDVLDSAAVAYISAADFLAELQKKM